MSPPFIWRSKGSYFGPGRVPKRQLGNTGGAAAEASPLGHWTFDETSGTAVADSTDNENDGTGTSLTRDSLNPVGDRGGVFEQSTPTTVDIGAVDLFKLSEFTYAAWIKPDSDYTNVTPFSTAAVTSGGAWNTSWVVADDGAGALKLNLDYGNGSTRNNYDSPDGVVPYDTWSHVAVSFDGTTIKMYVDGSEVHSVSGHGAVSYESTYYKVAIGARMFSDATPTTSPSRGAIDDVRVYGEVLTAAQIAALYAAGNKVPTMTAPTISGTEEVGETLTANLGTYSDADGDSAGTHTYQWYRADDNTGTNEAAISGATSSTYTLVTADAGKYLRVGVVPVAATGASPGVEAFSGYTGAIAAVAVSVAWLEHTETSGTDGGTLTTGSRQTVTLNSEYDDPDNIVTLSSNQFTLQAGTYYIQWDHIVMDVDNAQSWLRNTTDGTDDGIGFSVYAQASTAAAAHSGGAVRITIPSAKTFELQAECGATSSSTYGLGPASSFDSEVFTSVKIVKEA